MCGAAHGVPHIIFFMCMKRFFSLFLVLWVSLAAFAVKLEDRYVMKTIEDGQIYYIAPYQISSKTKNIKPLMADVTYVTTNDSVTMNFSVWTPQELLADSIMLRSGKQVYCRDFETFFVERDAKLWIHRYSMRFPLESLNAIYAASTPFVLSVYAKGQTVEYSYTANMWPKEQDWMNQILHIIATNKRLYKQK